MLRHLRPTLVLLTGLTLVTGLAYPLAMTGLAGALFPAQAEGSLVRGSDGTLVGSALIGQAFASARYFHGRPSATVASDPVDAAKTVPAPYNAANSGGANLGPTNPALIDRVKADIAALKAENPADPVPQDLVTTSGSGLDPDVSPEAALFQVPRVAKARGLSEDSVRALVAGQVREPSLGFLGERHLDHADGDVRALLDVVSDHRTVVHLVDVVARQHQHMLRVIRADDVEILIDGIGRTGIPLVFRDALACRQDIEAFVSLGPQERPSPL